MAKRAPRTSKRLTNKRVRTDSLHYQFPGLMDVEDECEVKYVRGQQVMQLEDVEGHECVFRLAPVVVSYAAVTEPLGNGSEWPEFQLQCELPGWRMLYKFAVKMLRAWGMDPMEADTMLFLKKSIIVQPSRPVFERGVGRARLDHPGVIHMQEKGYAYHPLPFFDENGYRTNAPEIVRMCQPLVALRTYDSQGKYGVKLRLMGVQLLEDDQWDTMEL